MPAVWVRFRAEFRRRWRAWLGLGLVFGIALGLVAAVASAARRTDTAADRFHEEYRGFDVFVQNFPDRGEAIFDPAGVEGIEVVDASARVRLDFAGPAGNTALYTPGDDRFGHDVSRLKLLEGRLANPQRADEVVVVTGSKELLDAEVGDRVRLIPEEVVPLEMQQLLATQDVKIVGVVAMPNAVALRASYAPGGTMIGTRALHDEVMKFDADIAKVAPEEVTPHTDGVMVRLHRGARDIPAFAAALEQLPHEGFVNLDDTDRYSAPLQRSLHLQAVMLAALAGFLAVVAFASIVASTRVSATTDVADSTVLRSVGMSNAQFHALAALRGVVVGAVGIVSGVVVAIVLSAWLSFGLARIVEPNEGIAADWTVLGVGAAAVALLAVTASLAGGLLARRVEQGRARTRVVRVGPATTVPAGIGVRFACTGWSLLGRGIAGPTIGIAALVGALVFGASLSHLRNDPDLYGWRWDVVATNYGDPAPESVDPGSETGMAALAARPEFDGVAVGTSGSVTSDGHEFSVLTIDAVRGAPEEVLPPIISGRLPRDASEIALGSNTLHDLGKQIGDQISIAVNGAPDGPLTVTVVGRVVLPLIFGVSQPGEGGLMPNRATLAALGFETGADAEIVAGDTVFTDVAPGVSDDQALAALNDATRGKVPPGQQQMYASPRVEPRDLIDFGRVDAFPLITGGVLALLAASTLLHVLVSSVNARRKDLATLRALGLRRNDVRRVIGAQAGFLATVALVLGVPLGVLVGRRLWTLYADRSGFVSVVQVPALALLVVGVLTLVIVALCAAIPAQFAAHTRPDQILRTE